MSIACSSGMRKHHRGVRAGLQISLVCGMMFAGLSTALAADVDVASRIDAVMVYPDAAQITRVAEFDLPKGSSTLLFKNLPLQIDPNSLRVTASGSAQISIGSVVARIAPARKPEDSSSFETKLRELRNEYFLLRQTIRALQAKRSMIQRYAKASPEKLGERGAPMKVDDWSKAWSAVGTGLAKVAEEIQAAQTRSREVQKEIRALQASHRGSGAGAKPRRTIAVDVEAGDAAKARFVLTYRIRGARWQPLYDARLSTGTAGSRPALELIRRARVTQRTGEDWTGVQLSVSTVQARRGTQAPDLLAQVIDFYQPPPPRPSPAARRYQRRSRAKSDVANEARKVARPAGGIMSMQAPVPARVVQAKIESGPYQTQFRIPGRVDLKADGSSRVLQITTAKIAPELLARATPALDQTAYLEAQFVNKEDAPLLPGLVNIHRDGNYVGRGRFKLVAPGGKVSLGFGPDNSITVKRVPVTKSRSGPGWIGNNKTEVQDFKISVKNLHSFAVKIRIIGRIPVAEDKTIQVSALPTNTKPTVERVNDRRGVIAWDFSLKPNASKEIRNGWQVQYPKEKRIISRTVAK